MKVVHGSNALLTWTTSKSIILSRSAGKRKILNFTTGFGIVGSLTSPAIRNAENSALRVAADVDQRLESRISQISKQIDGNIATLNNGLETRILQVDGVIGKNLGEFDKNIENRLEQLDKALEENIEKIDSVLSSNIDRINVIVQDAIEEADRRIEARINQMDESLENRIGNIDIVATKATLSLESSMTRFVGIGCLMVFVTFLVWRLFVLTQTNWDEMASVGYKECFHTVLRLISPKIALQSVPAFIALLLIFAFFNFVPSQEKKRFKDLVIKHENSFQESYKRFDFRRARYHLSQPQTLYSSGQDDKKYQGMVVKK